MEFVYLLLLTCGLALTEAAPDIMVSVREKQAKHKEMNKIFRELGVDGTNKSKIKKMRIVTGGSAKNERFSIAGELVKEAEKLLQTGEPAPLKTVLGTDACPYDVPECDQTSPYRTPDGSCNNFAHPNWGRANTPQLRFTRAEYADGISEPRNSSRGGRELPSARLVSTTVHEPSTKETRSTKFTHFVMQWGQFLDHDITLTPTETGDEGVDVACCLEDVDVHLTEYVTQEMLSSRSECFNIPIPSNDRHFKTSCMGVVRSLQVPNLECTTGPLEQMNSISAFIDASNVYGSSEEEQNDLRVKSEGLLKVSSNNLLPRGEDSSCTIEKKGEFCFDAGDGRANEQAGLTCMHTLFMREHNVIARILGTMNNWDDETIFQETRKIVGAIMQHITFNEYLRHVIGNQLMKNLKLYPNLDGFRNIYNEDKNPSIRNEFSTAAYRFGHSLVRGTFSRHIDSNRVKVPLEDMFFRPAYLQENEQKDVDGFLTGLRKDRSQKVDRFMSTELTDQLFQSDGEGFDLAALNIQRGRDHGIPSYNAVRRFCGLSEAKSFDTTAADGLKDHTEQSAVALQVYEHPDDIDLFPGAMSEIPVKGGQVGPTFACIIGKQFRALQRGDRFWYENEGDQSFTLEQLNEIKKVTLATIICRNSNLKRVQPNVFRIVKKRNPEVPCSDFEYMNLDAWKQTK